MVGRTGSDVFSAKVQRDERGKCLLEAFQSRRFVLTSTDIYLLP